MLQKIFFIILFLNFTGLIYAQEGYLSDTQPLTLSCLDSICDEELSLMHNEILARRGYKFPRGKYKDHFNKQDWYKPVSDNKQIKLSDTELFNIDRIKKEEQRRKERRKAIEDFLSYSTDSHIKRVVKEVNIKSIEYCGDEGFINKVEYYDGVRDFINKDEDLVKKSYYIKITKTEIHIGNAGYSRNVYHNFRLKEGTTDEFEKVESFMYSQGGLIEVYTIDENNIISYRVSQGIG